MMEKPQLFSGCKEYVPMTLELQKACVQIIFLEYDPRTDLKKKAAQRLRLQRTADPDLFQKIGAGGNGACHGACLDPLTQAKLGALIEMFDPPASP